MSGSAARIKMSVARRAGKGACVQCRQCFGQSAESAGKFFKSVLRKQGRQVMANNAKQCATSSQRRAQRSLRQCVRQEAARRARMEMEVAQRTVVR